MNFPNLLSKSRNLTWKTLKNRFEEILRGKPWDFAAERLPEFMIECSFASDLFIFLRVFIIPDAF